MDAIKNSLKSVKSVFEGVPFFKGHADGWSIYLCRRRSFMADIRFSARYNTGLTSLKRCFASFGRVAIFRRSWVCGCKERRFICTDNKCGYFGGRISCGAR